MNSVIENQKDFNDYSINAFIDYLISKNPVVYDPITNKNYCLCLDDEVNLIESTELKM